VTKHHQLNVLRQIGADQHCQQAPHQTVDKRKQHLAMVAAAALIAQRTPSSQGETVFRAGQALLPFRRRITRMVVFVPVVIGLGCRACSGTGSSAPISAW
jgi:hypothetical protein